MKVKWRQSSNVLKCTPMRWFGLFLPHTTNAPVILLLVKKISQITPEYVTFDTHSYFFLHWFSKNWGHESIEIVWTQLFCLFEQARARQHLLETWIHIWVVSVECWRETHTSIVHWSASSVKFSPIWTGKSWLPNVVVHWLVQRGGPRLVSHWGLGGASVYFFAVFVYSLMPLFLYAVYEITLRITGWCNANFAL